MEDIRIYCENTRSYVKVMMGTTLAELSGQLCPMINGNMPVLAALVDNKLKSLDYKIINPHNVRFVGYDHPDGRRTYIRSLCFVLQKVIRDVYPDKILSIDYSLPSGLYCEICESDPMEDGRQRVYFATDDELQNIEDKMRAIIAADMPFSKKMMSLEECETLFIRNGQTEKVNLLKTIGRFNYNVYFLDGQADTFYGPLTPSTGCLTGSGTPSSRPQ
jgi:uridine kinase